MSWLPSWAAGGSSAPAPALAACLVLSLRSLMILGTVNLFSIFGDLWLGRPVGSNEIQRDNGLSVPLSSGLPCSRRSFGYLTVLNDDDGYRWCDVGKAADSVARRSSSSDGYRRPCSSHGSLYADAVSGKGVARDLIGMGKNDCGMVIHGILRLSFVRASK